MVNPDSLKQIKIIRQTDRQKIILTEDANGKKYLMRELEDDKREIYKTLQKIIHPSIPKIFYVGFDDKTIVVEEYIDAAPLSEKTVTDKRQIRRISTSLLSALEALHQANIIHRDIKPDNILINEFGQVWLVDYEIARIFRNEVRKDTEQMGTFGYAPIEQFGMLPTDFKTDIYAFGVTLNTLLEGAGIKGGLKRIADKCKRLDPSQRYNSATAAKRAIQFSVWELPTVILIALAVVMAILCYVSPERATELPDVSGNEVVKPVEEVKEPEKVPIFEEQEEPEVFEGDFSGFEMSETEKMYGEKNRLSAVGVFATDTPYTHVLFLEDMTKSGKIKFGEKVVDAEITLKNGTLSVDLSEGKGVAFTHKFEYSCQFDYDMKYTDNLRKNADIICYDLDGDGENELLIGLNECAMGTTATGVNCCMAWCIRYDEKDGFTLCKGAMISKGAPFSITQHGTGLDVRWENVGDVYGYYLEGDTILTY